jgi:murein L,D-transpeptidase YafK
MRWNRSAKISLITVLSVGMIGAVYNLLDRLGYIFPLSLWDEVLCETCAKQSAYHQPSSNAGLIAAKTSIANLLGNSVNKASISILIEKSKYRLTVYQDKRPIKSYPIVLGEQPTGDKLIEGDRRTPEGIFYIKDLYPHSQWSKFLWLDYPNALSWHKHLSAKKSGSIPWNKPIGNEVGIHGVPINSDKLINKKVNWTWGCISLKVADIDEIYQVSRSGTLVEILP